MQRSRLEDFHGRLHDWYNVHGRKELPWRMTNDAYAIYVSEVMLQQTQVKTVLERFYFQFLEKFPTLHMLAAASEQEVLNAWQGLGYYTRARNLHATAKLCNGALPETAQLLVNLPGIGQNTAHAIAAFAFHKPVAVMEANVKRVLSRIFALTHPTDNILWQKAAELLDTKLPFDYNQAMMDIGALICKKQHPLCEQCPAQTICMGKKTPELYPAAIFRKSVPVRKKRIIVLKNGRGCYFATPRETQFLKGLYHFLELPPDISHITYKEIQYAVEGAHLLGYVRQQYSHFTLEAQIYYLSVSDVDTEHWYDFTQLQGLPMSMADKKIIDLLRNK